MNSLQLWVFRPIFQARAHFLLKVNMLPELRKSAIAYVYTCTEDELTSHSGYVSFEMSPECKQGICRFHKFHLLKLISKPLSF